MKGAMFILLAGLSWSAAGTAEAVMHTVPCTLTEAKTGLATIRQAIVGKESSTITVQENEDIVFAELDFEETLEPGTELEIWPAVDGEVPPWNLVGDDFPFPRNLWITDE